MRRVAYCDAHTPALRCSRATRLARKAGLVREAFRRFSPQEDHMHSIIYLVGVVVIVLAILSFVGLR
jgi:hypothetical protein